MDKTGKHKRTRALTAVILAVLLMCGCLAGCGSDGSSQEASSNISVSEESSQAAAEKDDAKKAEKKSEKKKDSEKAEENKDEETAESSDSSSDSGKSSSAASKKSSDSKKSSSKKKSDKNSSKKSSSDSSKEEQVSKCTVSITCHKLVGCDALNDSQKARVPSSGVIMSQVSVEIQDGDSVYDVLKRAASKKGVVISAETTAFGIYVSGIGGFYEKDAGAESGWKYKVNGTYPNDSASDVKVKDGDVIEWVYVLEA